MCVEIDCKIILNKLGQLVSGVEKVNIETLADELRAISQILNNYESDALLMNQKDIDSAFRDRIEKYFQKSVLRFYFYKPEDVSIQKIHLLGEALLSELEFLKLECSLSCDFETPKTLDKEPFPTLSGELTSKKKTLLNRLKYFINQPGVDLQSFLEKPLFKKWFESVRSFYL